MSHEIDETSIDFAQHRLVNGELKAKWAFPLKKRSAQAPQDVHLGWDTTVRSTELLGDYSATEATWHVKGLDGAGVKTDDVLRRSWLLCSGDFDAWLVERSVEAAVPCESGYTRGEVLNFTAMRGSTAGGYALEVRTVIGISPGVLTMTVLGLMPAWVLRSALGSSVKNAVKGTPQHVKKHAEARSRWHLRAIGRRHLES